MAPANPSSVSSVVTGIATAMYFLHNIISLALCVQYFSWLLPTKLYIKTATLSYFSVAVNCLLQEQTPQALLRIAALKPGFICFFQKMFSQTVTLSSPGCSLPCPLVSLPSDCWLFCQIMPVNQGPLVLFPAPSLTHSPPFIPIQCLVLI